MKARRPYLYVSLALKRKHGQLRGLLKWNALADREAIAAEIAHVEAVLRMFEPDVDLAAISIIRPYKVERERWLPTVLQILRTADHPMRAREIARRVMRLHGLEPDQARLVAISCGLQGTLGRLADEGLVKAVGKPRRWLITSAIVQA